MCAPKRGMASLLPLVLAVQAGEIDGPYAWRNDSANLALTKSWCVVSTSIYILLRRRAALSLPRRWPEAGAACLLGWPS
eukprot:SAG25_NODE_212_length_11793_cov_15.035146_8_plen_79_part_00